MAGQRLIVFVVLLVVIGVVASALAPRERGEFRRTETTVQEAAPAGPAANVVTATLPAKRRVRARVGEVLQITVRPQGRDVVQVPALGLEEPIEPGLPAVLVFDADRAGRFGVTLREAGRRIGTIDVREASPAG